MLQDLKDEALAIRLAADVASKKALEDIPSVNSSTSSSRQRIRDILNKQREEQDKLRGSENVQNVERKVSSAFDPSSRKLLWVFR